MTDLTPRDALEVVRRLTGGYKDREHALASGDVPIALAVLSTLVDRAGEPVTRHVRFGDEIVFRDIPAARVAASGTIERTLNGMVITPGTDLWIKDAPTIPPTAPGASHER